MADAQQRQKLVSVASSFPVDVHDVQPSRALPGVHDYWMLEDKVSAVPQVRLAAIPVSVVVYRFPPCPEVLKHFYCKQVAEVSKRLLQLQQLLGPEGDIDIVWMLVREPG